MTTNTLFIIFGLSVIGIVTIAFILYMITTNKIIKSQETEIVKLKQTLRRERNLHKEELYIVPEEPEFGGF